MIVLMGGRYSQGYQLFQHLTVKAFLAIRPYADQLVDTVQLMLGTGLPSFKGEGTIKRLRDRYALGLNERLAAEFMMGVIKNAHENVRSTVYDEFQRVRPQFFFVCAEGDPDRILFTLHLSCKTVSCILSVPVLPILNRFTSRNSVQVI